MNLSYSAKIMGVVDFTHMAYRNLWHSVYINMFTLFCFGGLTKVFLVAGLAVKELKWVLSKVQKNVNHVFCAAVCNCKNVCLTCYGRNVVNTQGDWNNKLHIHSISLEFLWKLLYNLSLLLPRTNVRRDLPRWCDSSSIGLHWLQRYFFSNVLC